MVRAGVASSFFCFGLNAHYSERLINYSFANQFKDIVPFIAISLVLGALTWSITFLPIKAIFQILIQLLIFLSLIIVYYEWKQNEEYLEIKNIIFNFIGKIRRK